MLKRELKALKVGARVHFRLDTNECETTWKVQQVDGEQRMLKGQSLFNPYNDIYAWIGWASVKGKLSRWHLATTCPFKGKRTPKAGRLKK